MKNKLISTIILLVVTAFAVNGQSSGYSYSYGNADTKVDLQRNISLEKDSKTEEIIIHINKEIKRLHLMINSSVSKGKLIIELYDPNNEIQGNFTIGTQLNSDKKEMVNGNIIKSLKEPVPGKWRVKLIPDNVTGTVKIQTSTNEPNNNQLPKLNNSGS